MSFFDSKWCKNIPNHLKPHKNLIEQLEAFKKSYYLSDDDFSMIILSSKWAVRKLQEYMYEQYKKNYPTLSEKELWASVILSRLNTRKQSNLIMPEPCANPLSNEEIDSIIQNIDKIISNFNSYQDVENYIIELEENEGRFENQFLGSYELDIILHYGDHD
jgi:hypothetical protein